MALIELSDKAISNARKWHDEVMRELKRQGKKNNTGLDMPDRYFKGYLGELGLLMFLHEQGIDAKYSVVTNGCSQPAEITVGKYKVEVKCGKAEFSEMLMPEKQKLDFDYIFGVKRVGSKHIDVMGWLSMAEFMNTFEKKMIRCMTRCVHYSLMHNPYHFKHHILSKAYPQTNEEWINEYDRG